MGFPVGSSAFLRPYTSSCPLIPAVYPRNTYSLLSTASNIPNNIQVYIHLHLLSSRRAGLEKME